MWSFYYYYFMPTKEASPSWRLQVVLGGLRPMLLPGYHEAEPPVPQRMLLLSDQSTFIFQCYFISHWVKWFPMYFFLQAVLLPGLQPQTVIKGVPGL